MGENGVLMIGKAGDFQCHMIQHQYGAYTHTNHGLGLAAIHATFYLLVNTGAKPEARQAFDLVASLQRRCRPVVPPLSREMRALAANPCQRPHFSADSL